MPTFASQNPIFHDDQVARRALEALRWPDGPACPHCGATGSAVASVGGSKQSHRDGLYSCKACRGQFTVTVGTSLQRSRVPLSKWLQAAHMFSHGGEAPTLLAIQQTIGVTYKTMLEMDRRIRRVLRTYKGHKRGFGTKARAIIKEAQPSYAHNPKINGYFSRKRRLLKEGKHPSQHTVEARGVLSSFASTKTSKDNLERTERLLRLLIASVPPSAKRQAG